MAGGVALPMVASEGNIGDGKSTGAYEIGCVGDSEDDICWVIGWAEAGADLGAGTAEGGCGAG